MSDSFFIAQNVYKAPHPRIWVETYPRAALTRQVLEKFVDEARDDGGVIGVASAYGAKCVLSVLAFATNRRVLLVSLGRTDLLFSLTQRKDILEDTIFCVESCDKVAFHMDVLASSLYHDLKLRMHGGIDLLSTAVNNNRHSLQAIMNCMGGEPVLNKQSVISLFAGEEREDEVSMQDLALRAWVAWRAATVDRMAAYLMQEPRIDTEYLTEARLSALSKLVRDACRLSALKPTSIENEVAEEYSYQDGQLHVLSTRFKNRLRIGPQAIEIQATDKGRQVTVSGHATHVDGRAAQIQVQAPFSGPIKITTVGKERATSAEGQREDIVLKALQGTSAVAYKPFFQAIWLPRETPSWPAGPLFSGPMVFPGRFPLELNTSQQLAVDAVLSDQPTTLIHGPPGTGKTTVIAAAVLRISADWDRTVWLVAQSNVAVKNIAEKLASVEFFDFKILVSQEFHYDWHEHLYEKIEANLIRSDEFTNDPTATENQLLESRVILCTLSMVSSFRISAITRLVPIETLIVDEASQVEIGSFIPVISRFSLKKLVFIGDDKQLAPYGQEDIENLQSVFEMKHLRQGAIFLDTQCTSVGGQFTYLGAKLNFHRMPQILGKFIGRHVYGDKLKTVHRDASECCRFVNVKKSKEIQSGVSWINVAEVSAATAEARKMHERNQSYRIITPYDAQRGRIENALKAIKIPWEDKVFCVDSFQGNEDDHIIVSIVRTEKIGFLAEQRRVNVMLSRCKKGLTICTSRAFVEGTAKKTLVGLLASELGPSAWAR